MESIRRYVALYTQKSNLDAELKAVKAEMADMEPKILTYMEENGMQNIKIDDHVVFIRRDVRATFLKTDEAFKILSEQGLEDALTTTINPQKASAICREYINDVDVERPDWLDKAFSVYEGFSVSVRKG